MATKGRTKVKTDCTVMLNTKDKDGKTITKGHPKFQACVKLNKAVYGHQAFTKKVKPKAN